MWRLESVLLGGVECETRATSHSQLALFCDTPYQVENVNRIGNLTTLDVAREWFFIAFFYFLYMYDSLLIAAKYGRLISCALVCGRRDLETRHILAIQLYLCVGWPVLFPLRLCSLLFWAVGMPHVWWCDLRWPWWLYVVHGGNDFWLKISHFFATIELTGQSSFNLP